MMQKAKLALLSLALCAPAVFAQEKIAITVAAGQPPRSLPSLAKVNEYFIPEVNRRIKAAGLNYQIAWTEAYAGSLLKPLQMLDGVKDGITGIGFIPIGFWPDRLPLEQLSFTVPFATTDVQTISRIINRLHKTFPEFGAQYEKFNQVRLGGSGVDSYELLTTFPVRSMEDIKGKKISSGGLILSWLRGTGATPVQGNMMEYYNSTKSGVYDGFIIMPSTFPAMKYPEVAPNITRVGFGAQYAVALTINRDLYRKLPEPIRKILHEVGEDWGVESDKAYARAGEDGYGSLPGFKATTISFTREQQAAWARAMPNLAKEWAANADKQGLPGTRALAMFMDELRKAGIKPIRDWDKE